MSKLMDALPLIGAIVLGGGLAFLVVPSAPKVPVSTALGQKSPRPAASARAADDAGPAGEADARGADQARADRPGPDQPGLDGSPRGRAVPPVAAKGAAMRHVTQDAGKWRTLSDALSRAGEDALGERARDMAASLDGAAAGGADADIAALLIEERRFLFEVRSSPSAAQLNDVIGDIEQGLNAAQQGGARPTDMPPPLVPGQSPRTGAAQRVDTGKQ